MAVPMAATATHGIPASAETDDWAALFASTAAVGIAKTVTVTTALGEDLVESGVEVLETGRDLPESP